MSRPPGRKNRNGGWHKPPRLESAPDFDQQETLPAWPSSLPEDMTVIDLIHRHKRLRADLLWWEADKVWDQLQDLARRPPVGKVFKIQKLAGGTEHAE